jgi:hypothetical protein
VKHGNGLARWWWTGEIDYGDGSSRRCGPKPPIQEYARLEEKVEETPEKRPFCPRLAPQSYPVFLDGSFAATSVAVSQHWTFWLIGKDDDLIAVQLAHAQVAGSPDAVTRALRCWR